jgi:hypothetical protein
VYWHFPFWKSVAWLFFAGNIIEVLGIFQEATCTMTPEGTLGVYPEMGQLYLKKHHLLLKRTNQRFLEVVDLDLK